VAGVVPGGCAEEHGGNERRPGSTGSCIDSLPQSWAWLSDAADIVRAGKALESAWKHLVREDEGLVLLFEPPFDTTIPSPRYIQGYPPGVRENGGQYTHAAVWLAMAMARSGVAPVRRP
jgi:cyclic beta-1,2-glucan synthetase